MVLQNLEKRHFLMRKRANSPADETSNVHEIDSPAEITTIITRVVSLVSNPSILANPDRVLHDEFQL